MGILKSVIRKLRSNIKWNLGFCQAFIAKNSLSWSSKLVYHQRLTKIFLNNIQGVHYNTLKDFTLKSSINSLTVISAIQAWYLSTIIAWNIESGASWSPIYALQVASHTLTSQHFSQIKNLLAKKSMWLKRYLWLISWYSLN